MTDSVMDEQRLAEAILRDIGDILKRAMPPGWGFALLMFELGDGGTMNYLSNADRADMCAALRELLGKLEP